MTLATTDQEELTRRSMSVRLSWMMASETSNALLGTTFCRHWPSGRMCCQQTVVMHNSCVDSFSASLLILDEVGTGQTTSDFSSRSTCVGDSCLHVLQLAALSPVTCHSTKRSGNFLLSPPQRNLRTHRSMRAITVCHRLAPFAQCCRSLLVKIRSHSVV